MATELLPHDDAAEQAFLGALMHPDGRRTGVLDLARPELFYKQDHRTVLEALQQLHHRGEDIDAVTVKHELRRMGAELDPLYVAFLSSPEAVAVPSNAPRHLGILEDLWLRREAVRVGQRLQQSAQQGRDLAEPLAAVAALVSKGSETGNRPHLIPGGTFALDAPTDVPAVWGHGSTVAWSSGEPLYIVGPPGVGKTTLALRLVLARIGITHPSLLGLPVGLAERPVLYVAADRPMQIRRALHRMVTEDDRPLLDALLRVHWGPLGFDIAANPDRLATWAEEHGAGTVVLDSLKDVALDLAKDEAGSRVTAALGRTVAAGIEVAVTHHQRKSSADNRAPRKLDDVYGSRWLTAGAGSVLMLWGQPGDPLVELRHLKQPAAEVGPLTILIDHDTGSVTVEEGSDLLGMLRAAPNGLTAAEVARGLLGGSERSDKVKARRMLTRLVDAGLAHLVPASAGGSTGAVREGGRYYATEIRLAPPPE